MLSAELDFINMQTRTCSATLRLFRPNKPSANYRCHGIMS